MTISVESVVDELLEHWTPCTEIPSQLFGCPAESLSRTLEMFPLNLAIIFKICPGGMIKLSSYEAETVE